jgi:hypothetical protein
LTSPWRGSRKGKSTSGLQTGQSQNEE